ncbi:MAG: hypothetical protein AAFX87_20365 [Bacteroidota bacterium]
MVSRYLYLIVLVVFALSCQVSGQTDIDIRHYYNPTTDVEDALVQGETLWILSQVGLLQYDLAQKKTVGFKRLHELDGVGRFGYKLLPFDDQSIMMSTNAALIRVFKKGLASENFIQFADLGERSSLEGYDHIISVFDHKKSGARFLFSSLGQLMRADGDNITKVVKRADIPYLTEDGDFIYLDRDKGQMMQISANGEPAPFANQYEHLLKGYSTFEPVYDKEGYLWFMGKDRLGYKAKGNELVKVSPLNMKWTAVEFGDQSNFLSVHRYAIEHEWQYDQYVVTDTLGPAPEDLEDFFIMPDGQVFGILQSGLWNMKSGEKITIPGYDLDSIHGIGYVPLVESISDKEVVVVTGEQSWLFDGKNLVEIKVDGFDTPNNVVDWVENNDALYMMSPRGVVSFGDKGPAYFSMYLPIIQLEDLRHYEFDDKGNLYVKTLEPQFSLFKYYGLSKIGPEGRQFLVSFKDRKSFVNYARKNDEVWLAHSTLDKKSADGLEKIETIAVTNTGEVIDLEYLDTYSDKTDLEFDSKGNLYFALNDKLFRFDGSRWTQVQDGIELIEKKNRGFFMFQLAKDHRGVVWCSTGFEYHGFNGEEKVTIKHEDFMAFDDYIETSLLFENNTLFITSQSQLIRLSKDGNWQKLGRASFSKTYFEDNEGNFWWMDKGVLKSPTADDDYLPKPEENGSSFTMQANNGEALLYRLPNKSGEETGYISFFKNDAGKWEQKEFQLSERTDIRSYQVDKAGNIWLGTKWQGLKVIADGKELTMGADDGLMSNQVEKLWLGKDGKMYIFYHRGFSSVDPAQAVKALGS